VSRRSTLLRGAKKGVAAVEFAMILPMFLTILFCTMDYGWLFFQQLAITSAAREGARAGALAASGSTSTEISTKATSAVETFLTANNLDTTLATVSTNVNASTNNSPETVSVTVSFTFEPLVGVFFLPGDAQPYPSTLTSSAVMIREF
jgi:Flp pilus assembly protein TadG